MMVVLFFGAMVISLWAYLIIVPFDLILGYGVLG